MPRKVRQIRADLRALGFTMIRQVGSHQTWAHPSGVQVLLAGKDGDDAQHYQERDLQRARLAIEQAARDEKDQGR
jgi:predicted RNA binding protein YcfA (HicA-like mRNA interferase family)